jgi:hypothetical protein
MDYIEEFWEHRKHLRRNYPTTWGKMKILEVNGYTVLELPSPQLLAGFSSYLKYRCREKVYFRGERCFHTSTIPSLFRDIDSGTISEIAIRKQAFDDLVASLSSLYTSGRFRREDFRPVLQHYGIKTDWLDLVDNIFVALWFSNHGSKEDFSYVKLFIDNNLEVRNLRESNSSLSLRAHCQHGLSASKKVKWNIENIDFNDNLIAIVQLPNVPEMQLSGYIFSNEYMFPNEELDNTFKLFRKKKFQSNLDKIVSRYGLAKDTLGIIK